MRLHLHEWGSADAPPVICLHGVTSHGERFAHLAERLSGYRVLAPDFRGHGRSTWEPPWRLETHVDDILETADAVGVGSASWVGHSFGGRVLLVVGSDASVVAPQQIDERRAALGHRLQVSTVAGGHNVLWDAFEATAAAVSAFLDEA